MGVVVRLLLLVTLRDLVDVVSVHTRRCLHTGHTVAGLAAGVLRVHLVPLPATNRDSKVKLLDRPVGLNNIPGDKNTIMA